MKPLWGEKNSINKSHRFIYSALSRLAGAIWKFSEYFTHGEKSILFYCGGGTTKLLYQLLLCGCVIDCWVATLMHFHWSFVDEKTRMSWIKIAPAFCQTAHSDSLFSRKLFITFRGSGSWTSMRFWYLFVFAVHSNYSNFHISTGASTFAKRGPNWLRRSNTIIFAIDLSLLRVIQFRQTLASLVFSLRHRRCFSITICYLDAASRARRKMRLVKIRGWKIS